MSPVVIGVLATPLSIRALGGVAYDRTIYTFGIQTAEAEDDALIRALNAAPNDNHFNLLFHN
jgi:hypothetical protein